MSGDEGKASLIFCCCVCRAEDIIAEACPWVDAHSVGLRQNAGISCKAEVNVLLLKASAYFREAAVSAILNVVGGQCN